MSATFIETGNLHKPMKKRSFWWRLRSVLDLNALTRAALREDHEQGSIRVLSELSARGLTDFQLARNETRQLIAYLHENEHIKAAIHGHVADVGSVLMVATSERLLYLHDSPTFSNFEEISYELVSWISLNRENRLLSTVSVQTRFKHYYIEDVNPRQAERFISYLESQIPKSSRPTAHAELMCIA